MTIPLFSQNFFPKILFVSLPALFFIFSCGERNINGFQEENVAYSIYGALDMQDDQHYIRVKDLRIPFNSDSSRNIDATVLFEDLETGIQETLRDSVIEFSSNFSHNYILNKSLEERSSYKITVTRSDGQSVSSTATTPGISVGSISPDSSLFCYQPMDIIFQNVTESEQIRYEVGFEYDDEIHWLELSRICPLTRTRNENKVSIRLIPLDLIGAVFPVPNVNVIACDFKIARIGCDDLDSGVVRVRYQHLGPEWQNVYPIYPNNPDDIGDVNNGYGFFGAYRSDAFNFTVRTDD